MVKYNLINKFINRKKFIYHKNMAINTFYFRLFSFNIIRILPQAMTLYFYRNLLYKFIQYFVNLF